MIRLLTSIDLKARGKSIKRQAMTCARVTVLSSLGRLSPVKAENSRTSVW